MVDNYKGIYTIGTVSELMNEHPETLRVWERNGFIFPQRVNKQRKYSNIDISKLKFIKYLIDSKGLNLAGVKHVLQMYPCWDNIECRGGDDSNIQIAVNYSKPCWKKENKYCYVVTDKSELCSTCRIYENCKNCSTPFTAK